MKRFYFVWLIVSVVGAGVFFLLLLELRSHDPYQWLRSEFEAVASRDAWNERKTLYIYFLTGFLISLAASAAFWLYRKIRERKSLLD